MTFAQLLMALAVFLLGIPAAFRNPTAAALVIAYLVTEGVWRVTGEAVPEFGLFYLDLACLCVIYVFKPPAPHSWCRDPERPDFYAGFGRQLCAFWLEKSAWDRVVIAGYPVLWTAYFAFDQHWWTLWAVFMVQLLASVGESLSSYLTRRGPSAASDRPGPPGSAFAMLRGGYG